MNIYIYVHIYICIYIHGYRVVESLLLLLAIPEITLCLRKASFFMMILEALDERSFSLQIIVSKYVTSIVHWVEDFSIVSFLFILLFPTVFWQFYNISINCHWRRSGTFTVNFEHVWRLVLVFRR